MDVDRASGETGPLFAELERSPRLSDRVAELILETIQSQGLMPGNRLPSERDLATQFGVSRTVIREAVRSLAGKGVVEMRAGSGLRVAAGDASTVKESMNWYLRGNGALDYGRVHEVRAMIEVQVAGLAAARATRDEIGDLEAICQEMEAAVDDVDVAARTDVGFHRLLGWATHNDLYVVMLDAIANPLMDIRRRQFGPKGRNRLALASHREILAQVARGDVLGARAAMQSHLEDVERAWEQGLEGSVGLPQNGEAVLDPDSSEPGISVNWAPHERSTR
jgi:GntR family transcriptional repressor for pyruvate dehydrogenase complex